VFAASSHKIKLSLIIC